MYFVDLVLIIVKYVCFTAVSMMKNHTYSHKTE